MEYFKTESRPVVVLPCTKCSDLVHWEDPEGSKEVGGGDQDGEHM